MSKRRVLLSAGGTGGHLFPAQALAQSIQNEIDILFVAGKLKSSPYFNQSHFPHVEITTSSLTLKNLFPASWRILKGVKESIKILNHFRPDLVVGFGSFTTFPLLLAAKLKGYPLLLHEQNSIPGKVNRLFAPFALTTAITFPSTSSYLKGKSTLVDFPLRTKKNEELKEVAFDYFNLDKSKKTLLVFGGSQGARAINELMLSIARKLPSDVQILHFTGKDRDGEELLDSYKKEGILACVKPFESRMDLAYAIADLALCRSGASTICELIEWELPAILIPFPYASENHQKFNASHFVEEAGGGKLFIESDLKKERAREAIFLLLGKEGEEKKKNLRNYKKSRVSYPFSELVLQKL